MHTRHFRKNRSRFGTQLEELEPRVLLSTAAASTAQHIVPASASLVAAVGFTAPASPTLTPAMTLSPSAIQVNWVLNSSNDSGVAVKRWSGSAWFTIALLPSGSTSYVDANLTPDTTYIYEVSAFNSVAESWAPTYVSAMTSDLAQPDTLHQCRRIGRVRFVRSGQLDAQRFHRLRRVCRPLEWLQLGHHRNASGRHAIFRQYRSEPQYRVLL